MRGALQAAIDWWYVNNLTTVWFGFVGLAALFYFIPKLVKRPLYSHYLGVFVFWTLAVFGSWGGIPTGSPLPAWMSALSTMAAVLTIVPIIAVAINVQRTFRGDCSAVTANPPLKFILFGAAAYIIASLMGAVRSLARVAEVIDFTWFVPAQTQFFLYGFFALTMFGAIYHIVPRLTQAEFPFPKLVTAHFWLATLGILVYALPLALGGIQEGFALNRSDLPFLQVIVSTLPFLRASTTGDLLMMLGHLVLLLNLAVLFVNLGQACLLTALASNPKPAKVAP